MSQKKLTAKAQRPSNRSLREQRSGTKQSPLRRREIASFLAMTKTARSLRLCGHIVLFLFPIIGFSQNTDIVARSFHAGDSVMLRWVPTSYSLWQHGNSVGYKITRFGMDEYIDLAGQDLTGKGIVIATNVALLQQSDTTWNFLAKTIPQTAFVTSAIFSKQKTISDPKKRKQSENILHGFSMKVCDDHIVVAKACGLFFVDHAAKKGEKYIYRIEFVSAISGKGQTPGIVVADEKLSVLDPVENTSGHFRNKTVRITFDVTNTREYYSGYIIERSEDSIHFVRINKDVLSFVKSQFETEKHELAFEDSIPQNEKLYWYRIRGYSYFGLQGPPSAIVRGKGKEEWNAYPIPDTIYSPDNKCIIINWTIPSLVDKSNLKGVCVLRNEKVNGSYQVVNKQLLAGEVKSFTDTSARFTNYYMLAAISVDGDTAFSFPLLAQLQDNDPPAIPENISGKIDTSGIVRLTWNAVTSKDLKGYRVFRCNTLREEFVEITDSVIHETNFADTITLNTLTRDVYYSVRSVDRVWNNSDFSTPAKLQRPDKIAPATPLGKAIYHTDSSIVLSWINSSSNDVAVKYIVRHSTKSNVLPDTFPQSDTASTFVDHNVEPGTNYTYFLIINDSSNNSSKLTFPILNYSPRIRPALKNFNAVADLEKRIITLKWDLPSSAVDRFIIYKGKEGEAVRSFKTLSGNTSSYIDNQLYPGNTYTYRVKALLQDGSETDFCEIKIVF